MPKQRIPADEFMLLKPYAKTTVTETSDIAGNVRIYGDSPETCTLQIRTLGKLTATSKGVVQRAFSSVALDVRDIDLIIDRLKLERKRIVQLTAAYDKANRDRMMRDGSQGNTPTEV